jgi:hypothetical protein
MHRGRNPTLQTFATALLAVYLGPALGSGASALLHDGYHAARSISNAGPAHRHGAGTGAKHDHESLSSNHLHVHHPGEEPHTHASVIDLLVAAVPYGQDHYELPDQAPAGLTASSVHLPQEPGSMPPAAEAVSALALENCPFLPATRLAPPTPPPRI